MGSPLLTITHGDAVMEKPVDRSPFVLGRDPSCDFTLHYPWLSRRQLVFDEVDGQWHVHTESRNEVILDGARLDGRQPVADGACILMGPLTVNFSTAARAPAPPQARAADSVTLSVSIAEVFGGDRTRGQRHLAVLGEISGQLAGAEDAGSAAAQAASAVSRVLNARASAVVTLDGATPTMLGSAGVPPEQVSQSLTERALTDGVTLVVDHAPSVTDAASLVSQSVGPAVVAPLGPPSKGVLYVDRKLGAAPFTAEDAAFCTVLAHLLGSSLAAAAKAASVIVARDRLADERTELRRDIARRGHFGSLIGSSEPMKRVATSIEKVAPTDATVLILGETGAGKELVARETHHRSKRAEGPFFALNCAALPEALIESELFGHKRGAFTGADRDRRGVFELAEGGTVFLDEIGELPLSAQAKVLRVLDAKEILPLGGAHPVAIDVRLVAATHRDLVAEVEAGRFRQDLLFRLNVFPIKLPPLRDRREDIPPLVAHFLADHGEAKRKRLGPATDRALAALRGHDFPGNVRELAHMIERAVILADDGDAIDIDHLPDEIAGGPATTAEAAVLPADDQPVTSLRAAVAAYERQLIARELDRDGWNRTATAKRLEISLRAFMDKLKRYELKGPAPNR